MATGERAFGDLLRRYRLSAGLTQEALAEQAGLSARGVQDLERGARQAPYVDTVRRLAEALGLAESDRAALQAARRPRLANPGQVVIAPPLPVASTSFVGRQVETAEIRRMLGGTRLLTLTGSGGVGKSRLALQIATHVKADHDRPVAFVEAAARYVTLQALLGISEQPDRPILTLVAEALWTRRWLLVLDGCEHVGADCTEFARGLLQRCPQLTLLATSRRALGIESEQVWRVPSLSVPAVLGQRTVWGPPRPVAGHEQASLAEAVRTDAVQLFTARGATALPGFALTTANLPAVVQLCRAVDGIPFALELAAARLRDLPMEVIYEQLRNALQQLTAGKQAMPSRQKTVWTVLDWTFKLLSEPERRLLERLCSSAFAEAGGEVQLDRLIASGLLVRDRNGIRLPGAVRDFLSAR
jgi:transcriptional regulator with XRE-family HTH domain